MLKFLVFQVHFHLFTVLFKVCLHSVSSGWIVYSHVLSFYCIEDLSGHFMICWLYFKCFMQLLFPPITHMFPSSTLPYLEKATGALIHWRTRISSSSIPVQAWFLYDTARKDLCRNAHNPVGKTRKEVQDERSLLILLLLQGLKKLIRLFERFNLTSVRNPCLQQKFHYHHTGMNNVLKTRSHMAILFFTKVDYPRGIIGLAHSNVKTKHCPDMAMWQIM